MTAHTSSSNQMDPGEGSFSDQDDDADLVAIWRVAWGARRLIGAAAVVCTAIGIYFALTATLIYRAETAITPVRSGGINPTGSLGGQVGGLAGLASLAGVNLDSGSSADREAKAILQSRSLIEQFIERNNLVGVLLPQTRKPRTLWFAVKEFKENVITIRDDKRTGITTINIDWQDAAVATQWANSFVALANERIRSRAIDESTRNISFLTKQISQTNVVEVQRALYSLIENETKALMLANVRIEYAFTVVDPAVPPERKYRPQRSLIVLGGLLAGITIGLIAAYLRSVLPRLKKLSSP